MISFQIERIFSLILSLLQGEQFQYGILTDRPYHLEFALKAERIRTYVNFVSDSSKTSEEFSEAGFFFTGSIKLSVM